MTGGHDDLQTHVFFRNQAPFPENPKPPLVIIDFSKYHDKKKAISGQGINPFKLENTEKKILLLEV